jgi:hypothetical protein
MQDNLSQQHLVLSSSARLFRSWASDVAISFLERLMSSSAAHQIPLHTAAEMLAVQGVAEAIRAKGI